METFIGKYENVNNHSEHIVRVNQGRNTKNRLHRVCVKNSLSHKKHTIKC